MHNSRTYFWESITETAANNILHKPESNVQLNVSSTVRIQNNRGDINIIFNVSSIANLYI